MRALVPLLALALFAPPALAPAQDADGTRVQITGEMIDTWCYFSGVMGGPDAVVGSAHHTCAMWCAAGGIPVGVLTDEGEVFMVVKWPVAGGKVAGDTLLSVAAHRVTVDGMHYARDGIDYLVVADIVSNEGVANDNIDDWGPVPGFAIPELN